MTSASVHPRRRMLTRTALSLTAAGAIVLGLAAPAAAFTDPDVSGCLDFKHSKPLIGTKQKLVVTNTCSAGPFGFKIHNWSLISQETTPCIEIEAHETGGWRWTKGRGHFEILSC